MAREPKAPAAADAVVASTMSTPQHVRLECVKLAYRHDRTAQDTIAKAVDLERYVLIGQPASAHAENDGQAAQDSGPI